MSESRKYQKNNRTKIKSKKKIKSYYFGLFSEIIAIIFLKLKFYKILRRRYRNKLGEIDIIAKKNDFLIAIEVKARKNILLIDEVLSNKQMNRIKRSMNIFYSNKKYYGKLSIRYDLIIIQPYKFPIHLKNFWE
jgi:putative endonuclease